MIRISLWKFWTRKDSVQFSHSVMSDSLRPHGLQHTRLPCSSPSPRACSNSCPLSWWWTGKPGMLQSMGSQRVRHNWVTEQQQQTQMDFTWTKPPSPCFPLFINFHFLAAAQCPTFLLSLSQLFYSLIQSPLHKLKLNSFIKEPLPYCDGLLLIKACPYHFN